MYVYYALRSDTGNTITLSHSHFKHEMVKIFFFLFFIFLSYWFLVIKQLHIIILNSKSQES